MLAHVLAYDHQTLLDALRRGWVFKRKWLINSCKQWRKGLVRENWQ